MTVVSIFNIHCLETIPHTHSFFPLTFFLVCVDNIKKKKRKSMLFSTKTAVQRGFGTLCGLSLKNSFRVRSPLSNKAKLSIIFFEVFLKNSFQSVKKY